MLKPFKLDGWKRWEKPNMHETETADYIAYRDVHKNRILIFRSADEMISSFKKNHVFYGGEAWTNKQNMECDLDREHKWRFGSDFSNLRETNLALEVGKAAKKYNDSVERIKGELFDQFPKLYELTAIAVEKRMRTEYSETGDDLEMEKFFSGEEKAFRSKKKKDTHVKAARVYIDICVSGQTSTEVVTKNLIYSLVMADIIHTAGIPVEIIVGATSDGATDCAKLYNVSCVAKSHEEQFDISRILTFALPGVFREYCFGVWSNVNDGKGVDSGLGSVCRTNERMLPILNFFDADLAIRGGDGAMSPKQITAIIEGVCKVFNMRIDGTGTAVGDGESDHGGSWSQMGAWEPDGEGAAADEREKYQERKARKSAEPREDETQQERIDRLLDKISREGWDSLSATDRRFMKEQGENWEDDEDNEDDKNDW